MGAIVVGYDGSDSGKAALERAKGLAKGLGDEIVLVFGYAPPGIWGGEIAEHEEAIEELGEKLMGEARRQVETDGVSAGYELVALRGAEALLEVARARDARMIVVGSSGEAPLKGAILGSTPYKLLHQADRPVLVVPALLVMPPSRALTVEELEFARSGGCDSRVQRPRWKPTSFGSLLMRELAGLGRRLASSASSLSTSARRISSPPSQ